MDRIHSWARKARRWAISAFILGHLTATAIWIAPQCPIRRASYNTLSYYMMPTGLWQYWAMFAPDPQANSVTVEAEVTDVHGLQHLYAFPRVADYSWWRRTPRFRYPKFASNLMFEDAAMHRKIVSRHAVRQLELPESAYPVDVKLLFNVRETPKPGGPPADPMKPGTLQVVATYHFTGIEEVRQ